MGGTVAAVAGILLCGVLLVAVLRPQKPELALCLTVAVGAAVTILLLGQITPLITAIRRLLSAGAFSDDYFAVMLKAGGICLLTQMTADTCRDAGETALAGKAELAGRVLLLTVAVPLFEEILHLITGLIGGMAVSP